MKRKFIGSDDPEVAKDFTIGKIYTFGEEYPMLGGGFQDVRGDNGKLWYMLIDGTAVTDFEVVE